MVKNSSVQSLISLVIFGIILLVLGTLLGTNGVLPLALMCLILGVFFCGAGIGAIRRYK